MSHVIGLSSAREPVRTRTPRRRHGCQAAAGLLVVAFLVLGPLARAQAASSVPLGADSSLAVLANSAITNSGPTVLTGNVGLSPGPSSAVTGFPPGTVSGGALYTADGVSLQAQTDLTVAYNNAAGQTSTTTISADLAGSTLTPGVYSSTSSLSLGGSLTLNGAGNPNAVFIFQAGTTLNAASNSRVLLIGGAQACNVFWQVGDSATIGLSSAFAGTIMAMNSITMDTSASLSGRALARNGAVTLQTNAITTPTCVPQTTTVPVASTTPPVSVSVPPSSTDTSTTTTTGKAVTVVLHGSDPTGAPLTYTITSGPSHGTLGPVDQVTGAVTYTPARGYTGHDGFSYQVTSSDGTSTIATSGITIKISAATARARARAKAKARARARAKAKAEGPSRPAVKKPAFTG